MIERSLDSLLVDLQLYDTVKRGGGPIMNVKKQLGATWRRSIRSVGGYWLGTAEFRGDPFDMQDLFLTGLTREIRETYGGLITWAGMIVEMVLTLGGRQYTRRWADLANRVQVIYTRLGDNQFTNGSVESGAWSAYNTPTTRAQSTAWIADGTYSLHLVTDSSAANVLTNGSAETLVSPSFWSNYFSPTTLAQSTFWVYAGTYSAHIVGNSANDGAVIEPGIISVLAATIYDCQVQVDIIAGTWKLEVYRTDTDATLASTTESRTGVLQMQCSVPVTNTYAGGVNVRLYCTTTSGEIYADDARFQARAYQGAIIQTGITIVAAKAYECQVSVKIVSGTWKLEIYRTDTDATLGSGTENNTGQRTMRASISDTNTYAGTIGVRLYCTTVTGEIYADGAAFRETAVQARTSWLANTQAQSDFGTLELALLQGAMSDAAANAHAATALAQLAWPRTIPPELFMPEMLAGEAGMRYVEGGAAASLGKHGELALANPSVISDPMRMEGAALSIVVAGYAFSLRNKYTSRGGTTQAASTHVSNLIGDSEFVTAGSIATNSFQYQVDDRAPLRVWEVLRDIAIAGDASGNRWTAGVYGNRVFNYAQAGTKPDYHLRGGELITGSGGPSDPWLALPGLVYMDDMPAGPGGLSGNSSDDPHVVFVEEVEWDVAGWLAGRSGLTFRQLASGDEAR